MRSFSSIFVALSLSVIAAGAVAQEYPTKPITLVIPFPPGGSTDRMGRLLAQRISDEFKQPIIVENRGGAAGIVGTGTVARAHPDGYTLLLTAMAPITLAPSLPLVEQLSYDPQRDLVAIAPVNKMPLMLAVSANSSIKSVAQLAYEAKNRPGELNHASIGVGSFGHIASALLNQRLGIETTHIPYSGGSAIGIAASTGEVDYIFSVPPDVIPLAEGGRLRPLAVASSARWPKAPDVPTFEEIGLAGLHAESWQGLFAPAGTPAFVVAKVNKVVATVLQDQKLIDAFLTAGSVPYHLEPQAFAQAIAAETETWREVLAKSDISQ